MNRARGDDLAQSAGRAAAALEPLSAPGRSFASDNAAGAHPDVLAALASVNGGHVEAYGEDPWTRRLDALFAELFGRPVAVALTFGGTGANVVALHALCTADSTVVCTRRAHIMIDEAGAVERITGAQMDCYPAEEGKLVPAQVEQAAAELACTHITDAPHAPHVVAVTQASEVGTVYSPEELRAVCDVAHRHQMAVHVDGARILNAFAAWGYRPGDGRGLGGACRALASTGVDTIAFGGTKAGLVGAEAVVVLDPARVTELSERRKQATQTASKMRFLAAQFLAALENDAALGWAVHANEMAARLARGLDGVGGIHLGFASDSNAVFAYLPPAAIKPLLAWTDFYVWDAPTALVRFVAAWDTTPADVGALLAGITAAVTAVGPAAVPAAPGGSF